MIEGAERILRIRSNCPRTPKIPFYTRSCKYSHHAVRDLFFRTAFAELRRTNMSFVMYVRPSLSYLDILMN